jgi:hypothetical protein
MATMAKWVFRVALFVSALAGSTASAGADERLCDPSWENCRVPLISLIDHEQVGIDVGVWVIKDGRIPAALIRAARRGVPIRMIMDPRADASYAGNAQFISDMAAAGIRMRKRTAEEICNWKLMIFAGQHTVEFSGANYSPTAFVPNDPNTDYEDEVIKFSSDLASSFKTRFDDIWTNTTDYANYANVTGPLTRTYPLFPIDPGLNFPPAQSYQNRLIPLIDAEPAGGQIDVDMYRMTLSRPIDALIRAAARGVHIRFYGEPLEYRNTLRLTDAYNTDRLYIASLTYPGTIDMRMRQHQGVNHQKSVWLHAQHIVVFGSSDWSEAGDGNQLEANYFSSGDDFDVLLSTFDRKWSNAAPNGAIETVGFDPLKPDAPVNQLPANAAMAVAAAGTTLTWNGGSWAWKYDIYFGDTPDPGLIWSTGEAGTGVRTFALPELVPGRTYYWKIVSYTMAGLFRTGPTWSFTTSLSPPDSACESVTLDRTAQSVGGGEANWIINVAAPNAVCSWVATSDAAWLVVKSTSPAPATGSGYVKVRAVANTGPRRTGHFIVGGVSYTVTQGGGS